MSSIVVGLSGGVDSSVAAALLREAGHDVVGVTLRTAPWEAPEEAATRFGSCCSPATAGTARQVARRLDIPYYLLNHEREFGERVIADFLVGAHAVTGSDRLLTRDRGFYRSYFERLAVLDPSR